MKEAALPIVGEALAHVKEALAHWKALAGLSAPPHCPRCGDPLPDRGFQVICDGCYDALALWDRWRPLPMRFDSGEDRILREAAALGEYAGPLRDAVHRLKFRSQRRLGLALGYVMGAVAMGHPQVARVDGVVPVPLHPQRAWQRGFNQADILAQGTARMLGCPVTPVLERRRATGQQAILGEEERVLNVRGAFAAPDPKSVRGKSLLLIDDVVTTGATLREAAAALKAAGAAHVFALALAWSPRRQEAGAMTAARRRNSTSRSVVSDVGRIKEGVAVLKDESDHRRKMVSADGRAARR